MDEKKATSFDNEDDYNAAMVDAMIKAEVEVIAITDHQNVKSSASLSMAARKAGLYVFNGFELESKDGIHFLALFDESKPLEFLDRVLGQCGILEAKDRNKPCQLDSQELLSKIHDLDGVSIACHIFMKKGLLHASGRSRAALWKDDNLGAVAIHCPLADVDQKYQDILKNVDPTYKRERPMAIVNCNDVWDPSQLESGGATSFIKMSALSVEALRQAFLDPQSRIRLSSEPLPEPRMELLAVEWTGGFLDGVRLHFNNAMNVLIGGRGSGKSTVIESLRYGLGLQPLGADAKAMASSVQRHVLGNGTRIKLYLRTHKPSTKVFTVERTIPDPAIVRNESGKILDVNPSDIFAGIQIYGQHEIGEVAKSRTQLTALLERFAKENDDIVQRRAALLKQLELNRGEIVRLASDEQEVSARLSALPALELRLERFEELGLQSKLKNKAKLIHEEALISRAQKALEPFRKIERELRAKLPIDATFANEVARKRLDADASLSDVETSLNAMSANLVSLDETMSSVIASTESALVSSRELWNKRSQAEAEEYAAALRQLQEDEIDGAEYIKLKARIEELKPLASQSSSLQTILKKAWETRKTLLADWDDVQRQRFQLYDDAARTLSKRLNGRLMIKVQFQGDRSPLADYIDKLGGRLKELKTLTEEQSFSLREFSQAVVDGRAELKDRYSNLTDAQAEKLISAELSFKLMLQEIELCHTTSIELNVGPPKGSVRWRALEHLSTGQRATAVLLLLLIGADAPLVIDQPEDDLDNAFISESIVQELRSSKRNRQFIFATHNANIPVLADAELIAGLVPEGEAGSGHATIPLETVGSIDMPNVRDLVGQVLEGGREAFDTRRVKYGY
ncbi:MAG: AAA family ATPase [Candidatus Cybelea sp.]